jgi:hypothetical protein
MGADREILIPPINATALTPRMKFVLIEFHRASVYAQDIGINIWDLAVFEKDHDDPEGGLELAGAWCSCDPGNSVTNR